jgi:hypothetical protein
MKTPYMGEVIRREFEAMKTPSVGMRNRLSGPSNWSEKPASLVK